MKKVISLLLTVFALFTFASCEEEIEIEIPEYYSATFFAMDTEITVKLATDTGKLNEENKKIYHDNAHLSEIISECANICSETEALISRTKAESVISDLNTTADYFIDVNDEALSLIKRSFEISDMTGGAFDVTLGTVSELWNVTGDSAAVPSDEALSEALSHVGYKKVAIDNRNLKKEDRQTKFDLGAIGKGYALGKVIDYLKTTDVVYGLVSFGGNVGVFGEKPETVTFKVGITNALETDKVVGYVFIVDEFVSVSGDYERFFVADGVKYSHIFDPATGRPADTDITSVAVICDDPSLCDALSTALFVKGSEGAIEFYNSGAADFEALIQTKDGQIILTDGLKKDGAFEEYVEPVESETE